MNSITIRQNAYDAIKWCANQFGPNFKVANNFPGETWTFSFPTDRAAMMFALKWGCA
jgi:hypothetical protein